MSLVVLVEPQTLLGQSLQEALQDEPDIELSLLDSEQDDFATLTEVQGEVAVVHPVDTRVLADADVVVLLGSGRRQREAVRLLPEGTPAIVVASDLEHPEGAPRIAGLTPPDPADHGAAGELIVSPHPIVVLLAHLLEALGEHEPMRVTGTIVLPASTRDGEALDELFEQTRSILNFTDDQPREIFGAQLAFNLLPLETRSDLAASDLGAQVRRALGRHVEVGVNLVAGPVFHGMAASLLVELAGASSADAVDGSLEASPYFALGGDVEGAAGKGPGPIDVAGRQEILVAPARQDSDRPDAYWIWAVMDNLTLGGATNAAGLVRELLGAPPAD